VPELSWDELAHDLKLARRWCDDILIHSLEGCVWHGFLARLRSFDWEEPVKPPKQAWLARGFRAALAAALWTSAHPVPVLGAASASAWVLTRRRR